MNGSQGIHRLAPWNKQTTRPARQNPKKNPKTQEKKHKIILHPKKPKGSLFTKNLITLLRVIPTMTFIHLLTGKSSGILSDISSGILSGILSGISSGILSGISSGKSSGILSGISSGILSGRWGPAVHTELGRSQVEVQRCTLSWECPMQLNYYEWRPHAPRMAKDLPG